MAPNKILSIGLAALLTFTVLGGVAVASPDTLDCTDEQGTTVGIMDNTNDGGGGGPEDGEDDDDSVEACKIFDICGDESPPASGTC